MNGRDLGRCGTRWVVRWCAAAQRGFTALLLTITAVTTGAAVAQTAGGYAKGIVIYKQPLDTDATARALLYRDSAVNGPFTVFDTGAPERSWVERGAILTTIEFGHLLIGDVTSDGGRSALSSMHQSLSEWSTRCPRAAPVIKSVTEHLTALMTRYDGGEIRVGGLWQNKRDYELKAKDMARAEEALQAQRQAKYGHMKNAYKSLAARPLLDFYAAASGTIAANVAEARGVVDLDVGLRSRSYLIPEPRAGTEAGVYSSDVPNGPTVIWVAQDNKLLLVLIAFCLDIDGSGNLQKHAELELSKNFLARFDQRIFESIPEMLAAFSIRSMLSKKAVVGWGMTREYGALIADIGIDARLPKGDGASSLPVLVQLQW